MKQILSIPILQMKQLKYREDKQIVRGCTIVSEDLNSLIIFFFCGHTTPFAESQFSHQRLNQGHHNETPGKSLNPVLFDYRDHSLLFSVFFKLSIFYFVLVYSQLTMLWQFQVNNEGTQSYIYLHPFSPKLPSHPGWHITLSRAVLYNRSLLITHFKYSSVYMNFPMSPNCPFPLAAVSSFSVSLFLFCK